MLSVEILHLLDRMGIQYSVVYPRKSMKDIILVRLKERGNQDVFIEKVKNILEEYTEINEIRSKIKPQKIYYANNDDTLEDVLIRDKIIDKLVLNNSSFVYKDIKYFVNFIPCNKSDMKKYSNFTQVYCLGNVNNLALVIYHDKKNKIAFNLPGGTRELGEGLEETLQREILEETNCEVLDYKVLGVQINTSKTGEVFEPQVRVFAHLKPLGKFIHDPGGSVGGYKLIKHSDIEKYIQWGEVGDWIILKTKQDFK